MVVSMQYEAPNTKEFSVVSQSGPKLLVDEVLKRLLKTETDAQRKNTREAVNLDRKNYQFSNLKYAPAVDGCSYTLTVEPRKAEQIFVSRQNPRERSGFRGVRHSSRAGGESFLLDYQHQHRRDIQKGGGFLAAPAKQERIEDALWRQRHADDSISGLQDPDAAARECEWTSSPGADR